MGDEKVLKGVADWIKNELKEVIIEIVGLDMEDEKEAVFDEAVEKTWRILGKVDAFVNCYTYEGKFWFLHFVVRFFKKLIIPVMCLILN